MNYTRNLNIGSLSVNNIISDEIKEHILSRLDKIWKRKIRMLTNENKNILSKKCYITFQPIGTQYYLYLTKYREKNCSFLISKKTVKEHKYPQMILLHMGFSDFVYTKDTMFDVNLVKKKNNDYSLIITDILLKRGERMDKGVVERYSSIIDLLNNEYIEYLDIQQFSLECTPIYNHKDINVILDEHINSYDYKINGLYIHSGNYTYIHILPRYNDRDITIEKQVVVEEKQVGNKKKEEKQAPDKDDKNNNIADLKDKDIVLQIRITDLPDIYHLYAGNDEYVGIANIPTLKCSKMIKKLLCENDHSYMECKYNYQFNKWEPVQYSDKPLTTIEIVNQITKLQE